MKCYSDFWMSNYDEWDFIDDPNSTADVDDDVNVQLEELRSERTRKLIRLSSARRAIANYVSILTGKNVPVMFNDNSVNCTDGDTVYLSSDITNKNNFDVAVGLALHEGSHIKYSDFELFKTVWMKVPRSIYNHTELLNISKETVGTVCKDIYNYVEDRYIDYTVHENAPGYRGYYDSLYDFYFNSRIITDALESDLYKTLSVESYMFRIINLTNLSTNLRALPGLYDIAKILDLTNIKRLTKPSDRLDVAFQIAEIIFKNITESTKVYDRDKAGDNNNVDNGGDVTNEQPSKSTDEVEKSSTEGGLVKQNVNRASDDGVVTPTSGNNLDDLIGGSETSVDTTQNDQIVSDIGQDGLMSKTKLSKIKKAFEKQKEFLSGDLKKKKVSKTDKDLLNVLEQSKVEIVEVAKEYYQKFGVYSGVECVVVKNMTKELLMSDECPMYIGENSKGLLERHFDNVNVGIIMGTKLGRRLQVRNEVNTHKFSRRYTGKLDKRLIHEFGFSDENIFYTTVTEKYKKINFHISVDASSSMHGEKWNKSIRLCVAIAKAASMLDNVNLTISFRTTNGKNPYILVAYDSRVDKFSKIRDLFAYLIPTNTTPEGLCYEAIMRYLPACTNEVNSYFVNLSDGEPYFSYRSNNGNVPYYGEAAAKHTQLQVNKIRNAGYNVISYFITDNNINVNTDSKERFKIMYGEDSNFINVDNISQIATTLNKKMMDSLDI
jgi:hypothetical protein